MIRTIDHIRHEYVDAITEAIIAANKLRRLDPAFGGLAYVPTQAAIEEMNATTNALINRLAQALHMAHSGGTYISAGGDVVQVGNVTDAANIVVGKDNTQQTADGENIGQTTGRKRAKLRPPGQ